MSMRKKIKGITKINNINVSEKQRFNNWNKPSVIALSLVGAIGAQISASGFSSSSVAIG